ncbi:hypothetical protein SEA_SIXAMA_169 [Gordonia phage Sixama]|uniref:YspA cpYpsA-related SLOG domain-containing protein n=1 Tax=Gordonia phage Sixama TaxID=2653271 RepID=A0A5Q2F1B4_9CAUD|nr:hypothetical protein PP302_gp160 [Gordonia phage Sixama]QGF20319.1 hypothetical protein SEA_SIXAMA_169 [Gordonia phage Sixama]
MKRLLITGSRHTVDMKTIEHRLAHEFEEHPDAVLVHGGAAGADNIAGYIWFEFGGNVEVHYANWDQYGKAAGNIRNQEMVDLGAYLCLAFPMKQSTGTFDCIKRADKAGIPVETIMLGR